MPWSPPASSIGRRPAHRKTRETVRRGALASGYEGSVLVAREGTLALPVDIELTRYDGTTERVQLGRRGALGAHPVPRRRGAAAPVLVDPESAILLDENRTDNFATARGQLRAGANRTLERVLYRAHARPSGGASRERRGRRVVVQSGRRCRRRRATTASSSLTPERIDMRARRRPRAIVGALWVWQTVGAGAPRRVAARGGRSPSRLRRAPGGRRAAVAAGRARRWSISSSSSAQAALGGARRRSRALVLLVAGFRARSPPAGRAPRLDGVRHARANARSWRCARSSCAGRRGVSDVRDALRDGGARGGACSSGSRRWHGGGLRRRRDRRRPR